MTDFSYDVSQLIRGSEEYEQLLQRCRPAYADFKRKIRLTAPDYRPFIDEKDEKSHYSGAVGESMLVIEDQDELKISNKPTYLLEITKIIETCVAM